MKILVTGATGYLGLHICEYLKTTNHEVVGFVRSHKKTQSLDELEIPYVLGDITDQNSLVQAMEGDFDLVINNAGYISDRGPWKTYREVNVDGVEHVAIAMEKNKIKRIIQISSIAAYGVMGIGATEEIKKEKPRWFKYGVTKQEGENTLLKHTDLEITILRPGHIVGRRDRLGYIPILYYSMRKKRRLISHGKAILPLVYLGDVLQAINLAIENPNKTVGEAFTVVSPEQKSIKDVATQIHEELGPPIPNKSYGYHFAFALGIIFEAMSIFGFKAPFTRMGVALAAKDTHFSSQKLINLGWVSTKSVNEMVTEWTNWRKEFEKNRK